MAKRALEGVRVLDLSRHVAGAYCTRLLGGLGADVIKVEPPKGVPLRYMGPFLTDVPGPERSALFQHLGGSARSVTLDRARERDRAVARRLAASSQVVVTDTAPGEETAMGLDYGECRRDNPGLVYVSISAYGSAGAAGDAAWCERVERALGRLLSTTGEAGREPLDWPGYQPSCLAGLNGALAALAALRTAEATGQGQRIDVSMVESVIAAWEPGALDESRERSGRRGGYHATIRPCRDGFVAVSVPAESDWELVALLSEADDLLDGRFEGVEQRTAFAAEAGTRLARWLMEHTREEVFRSAQELRLPFAMVLSPREVLSDPQHEARRFLSTVDHPTLGPIMAVGAPFRMSATPWVAQRAPRLGEHTEEVLERGACTAGDGGKAIAGCDGRAPAGAPLRGLRVVDLTAMWAGPLCTRILADLGAEVIKIESAVRPDGTRATPGYFQALNYGKRGLSLDLRTAEGREILRRLVAASDVVVESFSPRVMANFGLGYQMLREIKPDLVMLSMPAYGSDGPYRDYVAFGPGLEAMTGFAWLLGREGEAPRLSDSAYPDPVAGLHGVVALLAALRHRDRTGEGQWIDLAQRESFTQIIGEYLVAEGAARRDYERGTRPHEAAEMRCPERFGREGFCVTIPDDEGRPHRYAGLPFDLEGRTTRERAPSPRLGGDSRQILTTVLGLSASEIDELADKGVIG